MQNNFRTSMRGLELIEGCKGSQFYAMNPSAPMTDACNHENFVLERSFLITYMTILEQIRFGLNQWVISQSIWQLLIPYGLPNKDLIEPQIESFFKSVNVVYSLAEFYRSLENCPQFERSELYLEQCALFRGLSDPELFRRSLKSTQEEFGKRGRGKSKTEGRILCTDGHCSTFLQIELSSHDITCMEDHWRDPMSTKRPKKLDLHAPLLSTRRSKVCKDLLGDSHSITIDRVPFSWELAPGKPKEIQRIDDTYDHIPVPPKPPPSQWFPSEEPLESDKDSHQVYYTEDDGFDADMDDIDEFSDAMDMFSLSEAIDFVERKAERASAKGHGLDGWDAKLAELDNGYDQSSNFMIQRFLPAANALAASSVMNVSNMNWDPTYYSSTFYPAEEYASKTVVAPPTGCGLENLFTWGIKHKPCGIKSPVCKGSSFNFKPQHLRCEKTRRKSTSAPAESSARRKSFLS